MYSDQLKRVAAVLIVIQIAKTQQMEFKPNETSDLKIVQPPLSQPPLGSNRTFEGAGESIRISGGTPVKSGEFPFMVSVQNSSDWTTVCGGTLLTKIHVLTACTCLVYHGFWEPPRMRSPREITLLAGTLNVTEGVRTTGVRRDALRLTRHPRCFNLEVGVMWDIGIITATYRFKLIPGFINTLKLPVYTNLTIPKLVDSSATCVSMGWGHTKSGKLSSVLMKVNLVLKEPDDCYTWVVQQALLFGKYFRFNREIQVCTLGKKKDEDTCESDTGGPLMCSPKKGEKILAGVGSWYIDCAKPNLPSIFARLDVVEPWIREEIASSAIKIRPSCLSRLGVLTMIIKIVNFLSLSSCFLKKKKVDSLMGENN